MKPKLLITVFFCIIYYYCNAQKHDFNISYFGKEVTRPGIKVSKPVYAKTLGNSSVKKAITVSPSVGIYWHYRNHTGLFINSEISFSFLYKNNFMWDFFVGGGYLRTFLAGKVYTVSDNMEVKRKYMAGNNQFMPMVGIGFGKKHKKESSLKKSFVKLGVFYQYPHNTMWLLNPIIEIGTSVSLKKTK